MHGTPPQTHDMLLVDSHTAGCPHQDSRADKLAQLAATRAEIEKLDARLLVQRENDPAALQEMSMFCLCCC